MLALLDEEHMHMYADVCGTKGLFTRTDAITVTVPVPVKLNICANDDWHFDW